MQPWGSTYQTCRASHKLRPPTEHWPSEKQHATNTSALDDISAIHDQVHGKSHAQDGWMGPVLTDAGLSFNLTCDY